MSNLHKRKLDDIYEKKSERTHVIFSDSDNDVENSDSDYNSEEDEDYVDISELAEMFDLTKTHVENDYPKLSRKFTKLRKKIKDKEPNIKKILKQPLLLKDRLRLIEYFDIYINIPPFSEENYGWKLKINKDFKTAKQRYKYYQEIGKEKRNKMKTIKNKLIVNPKEFTYKHRIIDLDTSNENKSIILRKFEDMETMSNDNEEHSKIKQWINCAINLPYNKIKSYPNDIKENLPRFIYNLKVTLDKELYGMNNVKEQILLYVHTKIVHPESKINLGLVGCPGCGKTAISRSLAKVLDFPFQQICFGGVKDISFLKGHSYTYVGSKAGSIVDCLTKMKYKNGILFLDEYEKISDKNDITAALLHITDPMQNSEFQDFYLGDIKIDLSYLWFIYSMNNLPQDDALKDRIFVVKVPGYDKKDKIKIIINYLLPKACKRLNKENMILIDEDTADYMVSKVSTVDDKGVRSIEKHVNNLCNKIDFCVNIGNLEKLQLSFDTKDKIKYPVKITKKMIDKMCKSKDTDEISKLMMYT